MSMDSEKTEGYVSYLEHKGKYKGIFGMDIYYRS